MAWGISNFENDSAQEWVDELVEKGKAGDVAKEIDTFLKNFKASETDMMTCCCFLAAAEIIAAIKEDPSDDIPENLEDWIKENKLKADEALVKKAIDGLNKITRGSELKEMYEGSHLYDDWMDIQKDLLTRLKRG
ncbi:MAG: DUF4259 domain-containing protein [Flavobacteriales bacterium]